MASDNDGPPHGKTKLVKKFTPIDFGPLNVYAESHIGNFRSGTYMMTTPKEDSLVLYRLYGGTAKEVGHYWTVEPRDGNVGFQLDYAMVPSWGSTLAKDTTLEVPSGIMLFEGYVASQKVHPTSQGFGGGAWQVLVPYPVVEALLKAQQAKEEGKCAAEVKEHVLEAKKAQEEILDKYEKELKKFD
ncbi:hypothetical protein GBAR_LOCUS14571 [Geodia barretti]|uniref:Uncharacterized protein n=1 Tax=Geodia barretti TaxID=519541 RepID=A0AA35S9L9_GEOBA|nr:hypothetical protein GBAR_LOCUS14571 [Geodia barretti]